MRSKCGQNYINNNNIDIYIYLLMLNVGTETNMGIICEHVSCNRICLDRLTQTVYPKNNNFQIEANPL